jgi:hypothetical protein
VGVVGSRSDVARLAAVERIAFPRGRGSTPQAVNKFLMERSEIPKRRASAPKLDPSR